MTEGYGLIGKKVDMQNPHRKRLILKKVQFDIFSYQIKIHC